MKKPTLSQFNAPDKSSDVLRAELKKEHKKLEGILDNPISFICMIVILFVLTYVYTDGNIPASFLAASFGWIPLVIIVLLTFQIFSSSKISQEKLMDLRNRENYETAMEKFNGIDKLKSKLVWLNLKGENLEKQFQELASYVGWDSYLTPVTGDGGIDVICQDTQQKRTLLVQCKGHIKPVGVGAIRDAIGVASIHNGEVIVVAPVGFTKGSLKLANDNKIRLLSASGLIRIANGREVL